MPSYANQTTWGFDSAIGLPGQIANEEKYNGITRTVETAAGIAFGQPAYRGTADRGCIAGGTFAATGVGSAKAGNVGTGTITASPSITAGAKAGRYTITLIATSATAPYQVFDPDGLLVGTGVVATANTTIPGITTFTISNAGTMTAGDTFYIDVTYTANEAFMGLTVLTSAYTAPQDGGTEITDGYPQYSEATLMTEGEMYVTAGASVSPGDMVYWNPATKRYTTTTTHIAIPGARFDATATNGNPVKISLGHRVA